MSRPFMSDSYVEETRFGLWFLRSHTWQYRVLRVAIDDLRSLFASPPPTHPCCLMRAVGRASHSST